ncbi:MAG TPA: GDSL-type esterase/lipase family protein [Vicinamibacterales bacterium]|nr:GDSL-type esterase/lipase family protein [Vicinamibacterales bacterium]
MRRVALVLIKSLITTVIFFVIVEVALRGVYNVRNAFVRLVPLPYSVGDEYGPIPPWLDRMMILVPDEVTIWHFAPNVRRTYLDIFAPVHTANDRSALLRRFSPTIPEEFKNNPTWRVEINSAGFRGGEIGPKQPDTVRIACVGDSWTFGMPVGQDQSYPARLATHLATHDAQSTSQYEVLNFGVLGYTSFQGLQLLKTRVLDLHPDIVAIGFGMNDSEVAGYRDSDMINATPPKWTTRLKESAKDLESYKLLDYVALRLKFQPRPMSEYLKADSEDKGTGATDYDAVEPWTRVSPARYADNLREMIRLSRSIGAKVILIDNELWEESPYHPIVQRLAEELDIPFVDSLAIITQSKTKVLRDRERDLGVTGSRPGPKGPALPAPPALTHVIFRVFRGTTTVPRAFSIVGPYAQLGNDVPNTIWMHDDGIDGDEKAGDGVWSVKTTFPAGTHVSYVYTNSGTPGQWEGLDLPTIRHVTIPASNEVTVLPLDTFGEIYLQGDGWHTNAAGYDLIARAVADAIRGFENAPPAAARK